MRTGVFAALLFCASGAMICEVSPAAYADAPPLFTAIPEAALASGDSSLTGRTKQSRLTGLDLSRLLRQSTDAESTFRLSLFGDVGYDAVVDSTTITGKDRFTSRGHLVWSRNSRFLFVVNGDIVTGSVSVGSKKYMITTVPAAEGSTPVYKITETSAAAGGCGCTDDAAAPAKTDQLAPIPAAAEITADDGSIIDVMVVYTPQARSETGGTVYIQNYIDYMIEDTNYIYQNSGVAQRVRLVYRGEVAYNESSGLEDALNDLTYSFDGYMDNVHTIRNEYGADLVSLLVSYDLESEGCGKAWTMTVESPSFASSAFSVVSWICGLNDYSFAHEIAHNMGLEHDVDNAEGPGVAAYSHGYRFTGLSSTQYRTVMAVEPGFLLPIHSNPNLIYDGVPAGTVDEADAVRSLNETADTVANFRQSTVGTPQIISPLTATGQVGTQFNYQILADQNPDFYAASGLPKGIYINNTSGFIGGTPTQSGTFNVNISVTNLFGNDSKTLVITIEGEETTSCLAQSLVEYGRTFGLVQHLGNDAVTAGLFQELYAVRDKVLKQSDAGRQLVKDYYQHSPEVARIILGQPELRTEAVNLMLNLSAVCKAGVKNQGRFELTAAQWQRIEGLLTAVDQDASPALKASLQHLRTVLNERQTEQNDVVLIDFNNQPASNQPASNQPTNNQPTNNQPTNNQPTNNQPTNNQTESNQPTE